MLMRQKPANACRARSAGTPVPGAILLAHPKVGDELRSEDVSEEVSEGDEVVAVGKPRPCRRDIFTNCRRVGETLGNGSIEF